MDILGFLGSLGDAISGELAAVVQWASDGFGKVFGDITAVWGVLQSFISYVMRAFDAIVGWLTTFWQWLRDNVLTPIIQTIQRLYDKIKPYIQAIEKWIKQEQQLLQNLYNQYIRPIMNLLQNIRRMLLIFRLLGFKWAQKLDARIQKIENEISAAFLGAWKNLNILADWINWIVDPFGILNPGPVFGAIKASVGAMVNLLQHAQLSSPPAYTSADQAADAQYFSAAAIQQRFQARVTTGPLPEDLADQNRIRAMIASEGLQTWA